MLNFLLTRHLLILNTSHFLYLYYSLTQALEEYSQAVAEERDLVAAQLKEKESEIEKERRMKEELLERLAMLEHHVSCNSLYCSLIIIV